jgi:hypothetical protein
LRSHSDTPHSVGLLWMSNQPKTEASTRQNKTLITDIHAAGRIQTRNSSKQAAPDICVRPRSTWDGQLV